MIFAEGVTLAHVLRSNYIAECLKEDYNITFATSNEYKKYIDNYNYIELKESISTELFLNNINKNKPIFDYNILKSQCLENRKLIDQYCPDLVIGDMRLSLLINRLNDKNFKYVNLTNSYFNTNLSLYKEEYPLPYSVYGRKLSNIFFKLFKSTILEKHVKPVNKLLNNELDNFLQFYFLADFVLTFDDSYIFKYDVEKEFKYINYKIYNLGYLDITLDNYNIIPNYDYIYINLGSSLTKFLINDIIKICSKIKRYNFIISTLDNKEYKYKNIKTIDYGNINFIKNSLLNINNSGILSVGQNILHNKRQLCIPHNFDQHLVFKHFKNKYLVDGLYSDLLSYNKLEHKIEEILHNSYLKKNINSYSLSMQANNTKNKIREIFNRIN